MMSDSNCKGCRASVRVSEESIKKLLSELLQDGTLTLVTDEEYDRRLAICRNCENLNYSTTCRFCGCIVQLRAKLAEKHCAKPGNETW